MGVSGNGKRGLGQLIDTLRKASSGDLHQAIVRNLAAEAVYLVNKGFSSSTDPYGNKWAALRYRKGKPLLDTARMRNSFTASVSPGGFRIGTKVKYAPYHQFGTHGRKTSVTRFQAIGKRGRFVSKHKGGGLAKNSLHDLARQVALQQGGSVRGGKKVVGVRALNFKAGGGGIPQRMMVPVGNRLGPIWEAAFRRVATQQLQRYFRGTPK